MFPLRSVYLQGFIDQSDRHSQMKFNITFLYQPSWSYYTDVYTTVKICDINLKLVSYYNFKPFTMCSVKSLEAHEEEGKLGVAEHTFNPRT